MSIFLPLLKKHDVWHSECYLTVNTGWRTLGCHFCLHTREGLSFGARPNQFWGWYTQLFLAEIPKISTPSPCNLGSSDKTQQTQYLPIPPRLHWGYINTSYTAPLSRIICSKWQTDGRLFLKKSSEDKNFNRGRQTQEGKCMLEAFLNTKQRSINIHTITTKNSRTYNSEWQLHSINRADCQFFATMKFSAYKHLSLKLNGK